MTLDERERGTSFPETKHLHLALPDETWEPFITSYEPKGPFRYQRPKNILSFQMRNLISCFKPKII